MKFPPVETILQRLGPIQKERVLIQDREFFLFRPSQSDRLLEQPEIRAAQGTDEYMPYWADIWPASRMLAKALLTFPLPEGGRALEIGCGLGLAGIVALSRGLRVIFSDYDPCALHFAAQNARLNGFQNFETLELDWRDPPPGLGAPLLLGADLIYELRNVEPLIAFIKQTLAPDGLCLMTDQDRLPAHALRQQLDEAGLVYTTEIARAGEPGGRRLRGTLYRIRHRRPEDGTL
ncbi:MAG: methyltransferase domain-containing protein [Gemmataceae bacterium]